MKPLNEYPMPPLRPEVERDTYGRYMLPNPENPNQINHFTRATTLSGAISDKYNLQKWSERMIVQGLAAEPLMLETVDLMQDDSVLRDQLTSVADAAMDASGANIARERGTQLHYFTEAVDGGHLTLEQVPDEYRREVTAYTTAMHNAGIVVPKESIERILVNRSAGVAGTADRLPVIMPNGMRLVADVKTGKDLSWSWTEIAMQLAIYAHADAMLGYLEDGTPVWEGMPVVEKHAALVMHVPVDQGKCKLWLVDIASGWQAVELAHEVREYRKRRNLATVLDVNAWQKPAQFTAIGSPGESVSSDWSPESHAETLASSVTTVPDATVVDDVFGDVPSTDADVEAAALDVTPLDEARRRFETVRLKAAEVRKDKRRRSKAQIQADERASLVEDGVPSVSVYNGAADALIEAYEIETSSAIDPASLPELHLKRDDNGDIVMPVGIAEPVETERTVLARDAIDAAPATIEGMAAVYAEFADVWTEELTQRGVDRVQAHAATVHAALDQCTTAADMGTVYNNFAPLGWCDEFTEYGTRRLGQ